MSNPKRIALGWVRAINDLLETMDTLRVALVTEARHQGKSWDQIGKALGVSRQAAWERFHDKIGAPSSPPTPGLSRKP